MPVGQLALTMAAVFTEAAIYINIAEQPARLQLANRSLLAERKPAYERGYIMQASLAIVGGLFGLIAYLSTLDGVGCSNGGALSMPGEVLLGSRQP
jgi:hypothetical protein